MADNNTNYLAKLLTLLIKRNSNVIRVPIQDLMVDDNGQGFQVYFDQESKELVLTFVPAGTTIYKIQGATTWLSGNSLPSNPSQELKRPLSQDELIGKVWTESAGTQTNQEVARSPHPPHPQRNKVVTLTSETMAEAELERAKQKAVREIENYQSPQPSIRQPDRQRVVFAKP